MIHPACIAAVGRRWAGCWSIAPDDTRFRLAALADSRHRLGCRQGHTIALLTIIYGHSKTRVHTLSAVELMALIQQ
jgi:hypothetical protein